MRIAAIVLGCVLLTGSAFAQQMPDNGYPGGGQQRSVAGSATGPMPPAVPPDSKVYINPVDDAQSTAEQQRVQGRCDLAMPVFRRFANRTGGEISQYNLGLCYLDIAKKASTPEAAQTLRNEGAVWILRSANAGLAKAQAQAVVLYLDGTGVEQDPIEAEKWAILYRSNAMRRMLRMPDLAPDLQNKVDASLDERAVAKAQARADAWGQTYWPPNSYSQ